MFLAGGFNPGHVFFPFPIADGARPLFDECKLRTSVMYNNILYITIDTFHLDLL